MDLCVTTNPLSSTLNQLMTLTILFSPKEKYWLYLLYILINKRFTQNQHYKIVKHVTFGKQ